MGKLIRKILVANRGEIAMRIMKTARKMGISTVAVYHDSDHDSLHARSADEMYSLGGGELAETYLNTEKLIRIAQDTRCDAIHPGYGFLSENAQFAKVCEDNDIIFIGPSSASIALMGNKIKAREIARELNIPVTKSFEGQVSELIEMHKELPYPVLIKAAAGGGGKGMKIVRNADELKPALESASREAMNYFGDGTIYIEQYLENPRHIEVQILGDLQGNYIHLFERECTIQRRHQKIVEEAPSSITNYELRITNKVEGHTKDDARQKILEDAIRIAQKIDYTNAGTVEFLVDKSGNFYFLEMNTRIQVEHPVTEFITGTDMVELQIRIASGEPLTLRQEDIRSTGHAIECRIYAEDPSNNFYPSPGPVYYYHEPEGTGIRVDSSIDGTGLIKSEFDPLIAKLICHGATREEARVRTIEALQNFIIAGTITNIDFLRETLLHPDFISNNISTSFIEKHGNEILGSINTRKAAVPHELVMGLFLLADFNVCYGDNIWCRIGYWRDIMNLPVKIDASDYIVFITTSSRTFITFRIGDNSHSASLVNLDEGKVDFTFDGTFHTGYTAYEDPGKANVYINGNSFIVERRDRLHSEIKIEKSEFSGTDQEDVKAPMFGKLTQVMVAENELVKKGQVLAVVEAMKMENLVLAVKDGRIGRIFRNAGQTVEANSIIMKYQS